MSMNKKVNIPLETTAYYQSLSKLNVQLWNQDKNTAELRFLITRNNFPLPLSTENVKVILALESGDSFISTDDLDIDNEVEGVATYIIPEEFMAVATSVVGQIYVATIDGDEIVVQRKFSFEVAEDLLSTIPSEEKIRYIKMFEDLKEDMTNRLDGVTNALSQLESNIDAVNNARETGITAINDLYNAKLVTFNQNFDDKMALINGAIEDLEEYATVTLSDMTTKKEEFDASVTGSGLVTTGQSSNWQKYKLTNDNGYQKQVSNIDFSVLDEVLTPGFYWVSGGTNRPVNINGFLTLRQGTGSTSYMKAIYEPFDSDEIYVSTKNSTAGWSTWSKISLVDPNNPFETTQGSQNKANTAENNAKVYTDTKLSATRKTLFSGSVSGVGQNINLTESMDNYTILIVGGSYPGGSFTETMLVATIGTGFPIQRVNLSNTTAGNPYAYEAEFKRENSTRFSIVRDSNYSFSSDTGTTGQSGFVIQRIEGIK